MEWKPEHVCMVVRNIDKTTEYYSEVFGIGPFHKMDVSPKPCEFRGKPCSMTIKVAHTSLGKFQLELIQADPGENPFWEFFQKHGEGLHHVCFRVDDLEAELAQLKKKGVGVLLWAETDYGAKLAYLDSGQLIATIVELIERKEGWGIPSV
jgi:methylmalonyl-CoA/ethylmalonyl-CoA epimerase